LTAHPKDLPECQIYERAVRQYVHDWKIALGLIVHDTFVPQSYSPGAEAQVDLSKAYANLLSERTNEAAGVFDAEYG